MDASFARALLDSIDGHLRACAGRVTLSRDEHVDALLDLRSLAAELAMLHDVDFSECEQHETAQQPTSRGHRIVRAR
jgi:hypothetical protein